MADQRVRRTKQALIEAYNSIFLSGRRGEIRVSDVVASAGVGRSTFYDHYAGASALELEAMRRPFGVLADAAVGRAEPIALERLLAHFWEYRSRARPAFGERAERLLADMIEERLGDEPLVIPRRLAARQLAAATLAPIVAWVRGEGWCSPRELAEIICRTARAQGAILSRPKE